MCHGQRQSRAFYASNHTNLLTMKIAFFFLFFSFFQSLVSTFRYRIVITHDVFAADVIPCWCTFCLRRRRKCSIIFFLQSESNGSKIEKNSFRCFYRCLLRTFWACSYVLFKCPHGIRVLYYVYMRKPYCLTQSRSSSDSVVRGHNDGCVCECVEFGVEAFTLMLIYYCRQRGIDMPTRTIHHRLQCISVNLWIINTHTVRAFMFALYASYGRFLHLENFVVNLRCQSEARKFDKQKFQIKRNACERLECVRMHNTHTHTHTYRIYVVANRPAICDRRVYKYVHICKYICLCMCPAA